MSELGTIKSVIADVYDVQGSTIGGLSKGEALLYASFVETIQYDLQHCRGQDFINAVEWSFLDALDDLPVEGTLDWFADKLGWQPNDLRRLLFRCMDKERQVFARKILKGSK